MNIERQAWVVVPTAARQTEAQSAELIGEAKRLVGQGPVRALVLGHRVASRVDELAKWGLSAAITIDDVALEDFHPEVYAGVIAEAIRRSSPDVVLFSGTVLGSDLGARVSALLDRRFHGDVLNFDLAGETLTVTRSVAAGRQHQQESCDQGPFLLSLVPDTVGPGAPVSPQARTVPIEPLVMDIDTTRNLSDLGFTPADPRTMDIADASIIVAGGRGAGGPEGFTLISEVADQLGASVGASRPAVEAGWAPYDRQVGQTGRVVRPKVYLACGISGASQHLAGMRESNTIITINTDGNAPIHGIAHLAIEGDLHQVLAALLDGIRARRTGAA